MKEKRAHPSRLSPIVVWWRRGRVELPPETTARGLGDDEFEAKWQWELDELNIMESELSRKAGLGHTVLGQRPTAADLM